MSILEIENLSKSYDDKAVIRNISLNLQRGEILGFLGANGAGKTTTIKLILGLLREYEGEIKVNGYNIKMEFEKGVRETGAMVDGPSIYPYLTGYEHLKLCKQMYDGIDDTRIHEVIEFVGLTNRIHDRTKKYSTGMKQRLAIAMAILHRPSLLLLDEPTNGLDAKGIKDLREMLRHLAKKENVGIFLSSHLLSEVENLCDRVVIIRNGQIVNHNTNDCNKVMCTYYVKEVEKALELIKTETQYKISDWDEKSFIIEIVKEFIPDVNKLLIENDIHIIEVKIIKTSLEDKFIDIIGGDSIA